MKTVTFEHMCGHTGLVFRTRVDGVATIQDEPYPPGGMLRVMRNAKGQALAGPLVSELLSWQED